jgi:predicted alpha/beta-hydrolase family hydrolase
VELRIYTVGGRVLRLPLAHGDSWSRDSTRLIPVNLSEPLDARTVMRYSIYYRAATPESPPWEIASAQVDTRLGQRGAGAAARCDRVRCDYQAG